MIDLCLTPHPEVIMTPMDGEEGSQAVLLHLTTHQYFSLNDTGLLIWNELVAGKGLDDIAGQLTATYDVKREQAVSVVHRLVSELNDVGLLGESGEKPAATL